MNKEIKNDNGEILIYNTEDGLTKIDVHFVDETVWLSQQQMSDLFQTSRTNVVEHIKNIYEEEELDEDSTCRKFRQVRTEGNRTVTREIPFYNLDMIISIGYRIKSKIATNFRRWATERLKEYIIKGFAIDDDRLKNLGGSNYFKELLDRIRDIRSSEKVFYRQLLDLFATSIDYNANTEEAKLFFATVQNKMHYAIHNHTAAELIYGRVDSEKEFMGLTVFKGELPTLREAKTAKNYLSEDELFRLNRLVSAFFDLAEMKAHEREPMYMRDWISELDKFSLAYGKGILQNAGSVSHSEAMKKVGAEYAKYRQSNLTPVEKEYINAVKSINLKLKDKGKK